MNEGKRYPGSSYIIQTQQSVFILDIESEIHCLTCGVNQQQFQPTAA